MWWFLSYSTLVFMIGLISPIHWLKDYWFNVALPLLWRLCFRCPLVKLRTDPAPSHRKNARRWNSWWCPGKKSEEATLLWPSSCRSCGSVLSIAGTFAKYLTLLSFSWNAGITALFPFCPFITYFYLPLNCKTIHFLMFHHTGFVYLW